MDPDQKISELQREIESLDREMTRFRFRLRALQDELARLKNEQATQPVSPPGPSSSEGVPKGIENFIGLKLIHIVGIVLLVIGLSIGVKYAIDRELISEWGRILLAYAAGLVLFVLSIRLRVNYPAFSAILFSGAMATIYFTTYAAFAYYRFYPFAFTFVLMVLLTIYTAFMALRYDRQEIGILGMIGAYGIPFLISNNADRIDLFFSYILVINIGIAFLSFRKKWSLMKTLAMVITWMLYIGASFFRTIPVSPVISGLFLALFYLLFIAITLIEPVIRKQDFRWNDIARIAMNQLALYLGLWGLLEPVGFKAASVTGLFSLYLSLFAFLSWYLLRRETLLIRTQILFALICWVSFVPMQWDSVYVNLLWLLTALLLFATGVYFRTGWPRIAAMILIGITLLKLVAVDSLYFSAIEKIIAFLSIGTLLLGVAFFYQKLRRRFFDDDPKENPKN